MPRKDQRRHGWHCILRKQGRGAALTVYDQQSAQKGDLTANPANAKSSKFQKWFKDGIIMLTDDDFKTLKSLEKDLKTRSGWKNALTDPEPK